MYIYIFFPQTFYSFLILYKEKFPLELLHQISQEEFPEPLKMTFTTHPLEDVKGMPNSFRLKFN